MPMAASTTFTGPSGWYMTRQNKPVTASENTMGR